MKPWLTSLCQEVHTMIRESVEIPRPLREAYDRWTRDETIPAAMRGSERHHGEEVGDGETPAIQWSRENDAPGSGTVRFEAVSEATTTIVIELEPEPDVEGGHDAGPRARGLLDRFRDSFPATAPPDTTEDADVTETRDVPGLPSNR
jgi:hypothetical protein